MMRTVFVQVYLTGTNINLFEHSLVSRLKNLMFTLKICENVLNVIIMLIGDHSEDRLFLTVSSRSPVHILTKQDLRFSDQQTRWEFSCLQYFPVEKLIVLYISDNCQAFRFPACHRDYNFRFFF